MGRSARGYVYHRDPWMAGRAALGAIVGILIGCGFWIWSAWPEGGMAVSILGVCCTLFGNFDAPVPFVVKYIVGSIYGVVISLVYSFIILPQVTDFRVLVAVLAPAFLFAGSLQARLPTTLMAAWHHAHHSDPLGSGRRLHRRLRHLPQQRDRAACGGRLRSGEHVLFQTVPVDAAINRLLRWSRRDVVRRALGAEPNEARWASLMIDRTALLLPRSRMSGKAYPDLLDDTLQHLRIGHAAGQLRKTIPQIKGEAGLELSELLSVIVARFRSGER